jgi:Transposase domain (DUF772)
MLIIGYCFGIRSERRLCEEVHLNLAYRWFCRESNLFRRVFETVLQRCIREGLVGGEGFVVDASLMALKAFRDPAPPAWLQRWVSVPKNLNPQIMMMKSSKDRA